MKIVLLEPLGISPERLAELKKPFEEEGHCFADYARSTDPEVLKQEAADADAVILANMPFKGEVIEACNNLKYIDIAFTGVDHVDLKAAAAKNIAVSNASGYSTEAVAELSVGLTLNLLRFVKETEARCRNEGDKSGYMGSEIKGKTVGIIGLGNIGGRSAELFHAFGAEVLADEPIVVDGNLITSCGPSTAAGVAFQLLEMLTDRESAERVKKLMGFTPDH